MTLNNECWKKLFEKYGILKEINEKGLYEISASQIKKFREPRLMVKFDYENQLPQIFSENNLSILPITRGKYVISRFKSYHGLEEKKKGMVSLEFPKHIESLDFNNITSEAQAINCAYTAGIIEDFLEDDEIYPTVQGRMSSGEFNFNILDSVTLDKLNINIKNSQIEIDGAYEGLKFLSLIEAKIEYPKNFLVRQLYYPFRTLKQYVTKDVKPIFLIYSNGIFSLYEYLFDDEYCYNSLKLVKQENYSIIDGEIEIGDLEAVANSVEIVSEPEIPFPQADTFERVISLCESLKKEKKLARDDITETYSFDARQSNYYASAGMYLGLINRSYVNGRIPCYSLSKKGEKIFRLPLKQRQLEIVNCILEHKAFLDSFELYLNKGEAPSQIELVDVMKKSDLYHVKSNETYKRRSRTILRWIEWILELKNI